MRSQAKRSKAFNRRYRPWRRRRKKNQRTPHRRRRPRKKIIRADVKAMQSQSDAHTFDPQWIDRLPYHFAKRHGVIAARQCDAGLEVWARPGVSSAVLAELQRALGQPIQLRELPAAEFETALHRAYERGKHHALEIVDGLDTAPVLTGIAQPRPPAA